MKTVGLALLLVLLVALPGFSQWKKDGKPQADTDDRKGLKGFGAHLVVIKNPREFIKEWLKPETPNIRPAEKMKRGESLGVFVFFVGCKQDGQGNCSSEVDYTIYTPYGSIYAERKGQLLWKEKAPPVPNIQMGKAILAFGTRPTDQLGGYTVNAKVSDFNAGISLDLTTTFTLK